MIGKQYGKYRIATLASMIAVGLMLTAGAGFADVESHEEKSVWNLFENADRLMDKLSQPVPLYGDRAKVKIGGELRHRLELRDDFNFNDRTNEDDAINLFRSRFNIDLAYDSWLRIFSQVQDAKSIAKSGLNETIAFENRFDLRRLYVELKSPRKNVPLSAVVGRQEFFYGDGRFLTSSRWSNVTRTFDAVKVVYFPVDWFQMDTWVSQVVKINRRQADSADHGENFYGLYTALKPIQDHVFDTFFFIRHNKNNEIVGEKPGERGQLKQYTTGNRFKGKQWNFDYGVEWAVQFGSRAHDDILAWVWHNELGYTFNLLPWTPRIYTEYNHGSGDSNSRDGRFETFDNLFPANHNKYGYIDFASLRNMNNIRLGVEVKPHKRLKFSTDYHWFFLDTNKSPWFDAGQRVIRPASSGASTTVGQEVDLLAICELTKRSEILIGYSFFRAGPFVKDTGSHDDPQFFYVQTTLKL